MICIICICQHLKSVFIISRNINNNNNNNDNKWVAYFKLLYAIFYNLSTQTKKYAIFYINLRLKIIYNFIA